jgi:mannose-6-phosphate isomerase-like protein (cupin superfamily)
MTTNRTIESSSAHDQSTDQWLQVTPGERLRIRVSSAQTMGAYSVMEVIADPHNGVPHHIHTKEEEHFIVLDGIIDIAVGNRRWYAPAGSCVGVGRGEAHAWFNPSDTPLRMLVVFTPGHIEGLFRAAAGVDDADQIAAIAARYGTQLTGPPFHERVRSIYSPRKYSGL